MTDPQTPTDLSPAEVDLLAAVRNALTFTTVPPHQYHFSAPVVDEVMARLSSLLRTQAATIADLKAHLEKACERRETNAQEWARWQQRAEAAEARAAQVEGRLAQTDRFLAAVQSFAPDTRGLCVGAVVTHEEWPKRRGVVVRCSLSGVSVYWDDGSVGDLIWNNEVAYNAYRLQEIRRALAEEG